MRILNISILTVLLTLLSCSHMTHNAQVKKEKEFKFNPDMDMGFAGIVLEDKIKKAQEQGAEATQYLSTDLFIKANDASMRGDSQLAAKYFKLITELEPQNFYLKKKLAYEYIKTNQLKEAEKELELVYKNKQFADEAMGFILGSVYTSLNKGKEARVIYKDLLSRNQKSDEACLFLARSYVNDKMFNDAHKALNGCERQSSDNPSFAFLKGRIEYEKGNKTLAKVHFERALKIDPYFPNAVLAVAALYEEKQDFLKALKIYKTYVDAEETNASVQVLTRLVTIMLSLEYVGEAIPYVELLTSLDTNDLNMKVRLALLYADVERFDEATKLFRDVLAVVPDSDKVLYYLGAIYQQTEKYEEAIPVYMKIASDSPLYGDAGLQVGQMMSDLSKNELSSGKKEISVQFIKYIKDRITANPEMSLELKMLEVSYFEDTKQYDKAIESLSSMKGHQKFNDNHTYYLATIFEKSGNFLEARDLVKALVEKDPNNAHALNFLGYSYLERNENLEAAFKYISKAVELKPEDGYIRDSLAWYHFTVGNYKEALKEGKRAQELVKDDPTITKHLGMIYHRLNNYDKANVYLTEALAQTLPSDQRETVLKLLKDIENKRRPASAP